MNQSVFTICSVLIITLSRSYSVLHHVTLLQLCFVLQHEENNTIVNSTVGGVVKHEDGITVTTPIILWVKVGGDEGTVTHKMSHDQFHPPPLVCIHTQARLSTSID